MSDDNSDTTIVEPLVRAICLGFFLFMGGAFQVSQRRLHLNPAWGWGFFPPFFQKEGVVSPCVRAHLFQFFQRLAVSHGPIDTHGAHDGRLQPNDLRRFSSVARIKCDESLIACMCVCVFFHFEWLFKVH